MILAALPLPEQVAECDCCHFRTTLQTVKAYHPLPQRDLCDVCRRSVGALVAYAELPQAPSPISNAEVLRQMAHQTNIILEAIRESRKT